jgi:ribonuclease HI
VKPRVDIFTDGACSGNPGPGGWAAILRAGTAEKEIFGGEAATTDSRYVMDGASKWLQRWKFNGWKTTDKKAVRNDDLWRALDTAMAAHEVKWRWIRGHSDHVENERADALARAAIPGKTR